MIADLNQTGKASALSLRKALYSIFDLDIYQHAITHIGSQTNGATTVLGRLYQSKSKNISSNEIILNRGQYNQALKKVEKLEKDIKDCDVAIERAKETSQKLSEKIGSFPSKKELEKRRRVAKDSIKNCEETIKNEMLSFGKDVMANYPYLFISRIVEEVQFRIGLKVEEEKLLQDNYETVSDEEEKPNTIGRTMFNKTENKLLVNFMLQTLIVTTKHLELSEDDRLELAFSEEKELDFNPIRFLTNYANFGVKKLYEVIYDSEGVELLENLMIFLNSTYEDGADNIEQFMEIEDYENMF